MGITPHPAPYPDIVMYEHALAITWRVYLRSNGVPIDITGDEVLALVLDDRVEVAELGVERLDEVAGTVQLTIDQTVYDAVKRYSTWRLFDSAQFDYPVLQGRLVKA
jgi:hypothetical protein